MKVMKLMVVMALLALISMNGWAQNSPAEIFVKRLVQRKNSWLTEKRYDSLQQLLDTRCLYIHSNGWIQTAPEIVADMKSGKLEYRKITLGETTARQFEKMVIVTGKGKFEGEMSGKPFALDLQYTEVYLNRKNGWKLLSRHACKINE